MMLQSHQDFNGGEVNPDPWEAAYIRFETPAQEVRKFMRRLLKLGAHRWNRESQVVELFCGRGNGLHALERLGFTHIEGIDLSPTLAATYRGPATIHVDDCRKLSMDDDSRDLAIVQGGLHHLQSLPADLEQTLTEARRVLRPGGIFVAVEPWLTPFLRLVHAACRSRTARRLWDRVDAMAVMIEHERKTYEQWLRQPDTILGLLKKHFQTERCSIAWGKLMFVGRKGHPAHSPAGASSH